MALTSTGNVMTKIEKQMIATVIVFVGGVIVIGNEGKGISDRIGKYIDIKINIPSFALQYHAPESLNASVATAIVCAEFRRRMS